MAELRGCYEALQGGGMTDAFRALTGCPVETISLGATGRLTLSQKEQDTLWVKMTECVTCEPLVFHLPTP
jgi:hypothetical protein